jgi:cytochrome oxidase Cu insertion factor (SCO1/SenC/PrrC family)
MQMARLYRFAAATAFLVAALASGAAHALNVGDKAPAFTLPSTVGKQASLSDFAGKSVVLFFYTGAFTNS